MFRAYLRGIDWGHSAYIIQRRLAFGLEYEHLSPLALFLDEAYNQESCRMKEAIEIQQKQVSNTDPLERIGTATNMPDDDSLRVLQSVGTTILLRFHCRILEYCHSMIGTAKEKWAVLKLSLIHI